MGPQWGNGHTGLLTGSDWQPGTHLCGGQDAQLAARLAVVTSLLPMHGAHTTSTLTVSKSAVRLLGYLGFVDNPLVGLRSTSCQLGVPRVAKYMFLRYTF